MGHVYFVPKLTKINFRETILSSDQKRANRILTDWWDQLENPPSLDYPLLSEPKNSRLVSNRPTGKKRKHSFAQKPEWNRISGLIFFLITEKRYCKNYGPIKFNLTFLDFELCLILRSDHLLVATILVVQSSSHVFLMENLSLLLLVWEVLQNTDIYLNFCPRSQVLGMQALLDRGAFL